MSWSYRESSQISYIYKLQETRNKPLGAYFTQKSGPRKQTPGCILSCWIEPPNFQKPTTQTRPVDNILKSKVKQDLSRITQQFVLDVLVSHPWNKSNVFPQPFLIQDPRSPFSTFLSRGLCVPLWEVGRSSNWRVASRGSYLLTYQAPRKPWGSPQRLSLPAECGDWWNIWIWPVLYVCHGDP